MWTWPSRSWPTASPTCGRRADMRVLLAMSGGVDSSVAGALLLEQGHDGMGATMKLWGGESDSGCCSVADVHHARIVRDGGRFRLRRATDGAKDQSSVLHMLGQAQLARTLLPVGELTKGE